MQHPPQMVPAMPSYPPANITSDQIQKYLDENKKLILAILDNQNLGKLNECAQYQAQLQKNLMYLAAIADAQPQTPAIPAQVAPHPAMQPGGIYMQQHPQAAGAMAQAQAQAQAQAPGGMMFPQKSPLQFSSPHQMQEYHLQQQQQQMQLQMQHQQAMQGQQMGMRPGGPNSGMYQQQQQQHTETTLGGGTSSMPPRTAGPNDARGGNKQSSEAGTAGGDGGAGGGGGDGETSRAKGAEESK